MDIINLRKKKNTPTLYITRLGSNKSVTLIRNLVRGTDEIRYYVQYISDTTQCHNSMVKSNLQFNVINSVFFFIKGRVSKSGRNSLLTFYCYYAIISLPIEQLTCNHTSNTQIHTSNFRQKSKQRSVNCEIIKHEV